MAFIPDFIWTPVDISKRGSRRKGRGLIGHVAVSNSKNLVPGGLAPNRNSDWHFYFPKIGAGRQYIDTDFQSWASAAANGDTLAFESEGGMGNAAQINAEPWTSDQMISAAKVLRFMHETEDVPYQDMVNSLASSRGFGVHRYGINPWRVPGGQVWSSSNGKLCPGNAKVAQIGAIVALAASGQPLIWGSTGAWQPPVVVPVPVPAPVPSIPGVPGSPAWDLPRGHYFGNKAGPNASHGGFYISERDNVQWIQRVFIALGCVPGINDWRSGWADGLWENATDDACRRWFDTKRPGPAQQFRDRIYSDDYALLAA